MAIESVLKTETFSENASAFSEDEAGEGRPLKQAAVWGERLQGIEKQRSCSNERQAHALQCGKLVRDRSAHYGAEWSPAHGYRGEGFWSVTRRAVESACVNEGLELTKEELNEGTNIWFYSGVTLLFYDEPYGSGWTAFLSWFREISGESCPMFDEHELKGALNKEIEEVRASEEK